MSNPATGPCAVCGQPSVSKYGVCRRTIECRREAQRRWREANPGRGRSYYAANREEINAGQRAHYAANREAERARGRTETARAAGRRRYAANRDRKIEQKRAYYAAHRDELNAQKRAEHAANPELGRARHLYENHGMRPHEWAAMYAAQDGYCYLCSRELDVSGSRTVAVEHDHRCCPQGRSCAACRRGLACAACNKAIGLAGDDPARLRRMADALEAAQLRISQRDAAITLF